MIEATLDQRSATDARIARLDHEAAAMQTILDTGGTLRTLRARAQDGEFGSLESTGFIPIRESDGSTYRLYVRDVGSFESPEGVPTRDPLSL